MEISVKSLQIINCSNIFINYLNKFINFDRIKKQSNMHIFLQIDQQAFQNIPSMQVLKNVLCVTWERRDFASREVLPERSETNFKREHSFDRSKILLNFTLPNKYIFFNQSE